MARILSIEDDAELQHLIGLTLHGNGYEVHYAFTGKEGYEKILSLHPHLIILDLMLPVMNGIEVMKALKENKSVTDIPVIVITAFGDEVSMLEHSVKALGAVEYLRKPIEMPRLLSHIKRVLESHPTREKPSAELRKGAVRADPRFRTVWIDDRLVATLSVKRFELLKALMEQDGEIKKDELLSKISDGESSMFALEKTIQRLREDLGTESRRIQTTFGGYELIG